MPDWIEEALAPYMKRVQAPPGRNGLSRSMNQVLRSQPESVQIIRQTMARLIEWELLVDLSGMVKFTRMDLYRLLSETEEGWAVESPTVEYVGDPHQPITHFLETGEVEPPGDWGPTVVFERRPRFPFRVFDAAMTIAKRVHLVHGYGYLAVHPDLLKKLRILRKQRIPEPPMLADGLGHVEEVSP